MDLETLIPIIIVAAAYLFKAFENARKKDPAKRPPAAPKRHSAAPKTREQQEMNRREPVPGQGTRRPEPFPGGETHRQKSFPGQETHRREPFPGQTTGPERDAEVTRKAPEWSRLEKPVAAAGRETRMISTPELPEEILRIREARQREALRREAPLVPVQLLPETDEGQEEMEFDLRDAVIQSVILERRAY